MARCLIPIADPRRDLMPYGDGPEAVLRVLAEAGDDDVAIYNSSTQFINRIKSEAADKIELWEHVRGYTVAAMYEQGTLVSAIAHQLGVSTAQIHKLAQRYGATPRNKTTGEREAVPFDQTPGISALERIRQARQDIVDQLHELDKLEEAEQIKRTEKTLERWSRRKGLSGGAAGGALVLGGAALGNLGVATAAVTTVTTASVGASLVQIIGAGAIGAALVGGPQMVSSVMQPPPVHQQATAPITTPSWGSDRQDYTPEAEFRPRASEPVAASPTVSNSPTPTLTIQPEPLSPLMVSPTTVSPTVTVESVPVPKRRIKEPTSAVVVIPPTATPSAPHTPSSDVLMPPQNGHPSTPSWSPTPSLEPMPSPTSRPSPNPTPTGADDALGCLLADSCPSRVE